MAVTDDLRQLAQQDVVYLTKTVQVAQQPALSTTIYRGRLRQALSGSWVFNTSTGQNGVVGIDLGQQTGSWFSSETPAAGLQVQIDYSILETPRVVVETITLTSVIPADLAD